MTTDVTAPAEIPLAARQGTPFHTFLRFYEDQAGTIPSDLTGWTFKMQIREGVADSGAPLVKGLSSDGVSPNIRFAGITSGQPDIDATPDPTNGFIYIHMSSAETSLLKTQKAPKVRTYPAQLTFFWDIEGTPPGSEPQALLYGTLTVDCEVTRDE